VVAVGKKNVKWDFAERKSPAEMPMLPKADTHFLTGARAVPKERKCNKCGKSYFGTANGHYFCLYE